MSDIVSKEPTVMDSIIKNFNKQSSSNSNIENLSITEYINTIMHNSENESDCDNDTEYPEPSPLRISDDGTCEITSDINFQFYHNTLN